LERKAQSDRNKLTPLQRRARREESQREKRGLTHRTTPYRRLEIDPRFMAEQIKLFLTSKESTFFECLFD
jgi:hypothetical protein